VWWQTWWLGSAILEDTCDKNAHKIKSIQKWKIERVSYTTWCHSSLSWTYLLHVLVPDICPQFCLDMPNLRTSFHVQKCPEMSTNVHKMWVSRTQFADIPEICRHDSIVSPQREVPLTCQDADKWHQDKQIDRCSRHNLSCKMDRPKVPVEVASTSELGVDG
jgi:hypothetical protein